MTSVSRGDSYYANSNRSAESEHEQGGVSGRYQPSAKLMEKMEMFSKWRIDPSLIEFPKDGVELHGGHATVSRAMLNAANSNFGGNTDGVDAPQDARQKVVAVKKMQILSDSSIERTFTLTLREAGFLVELSHTNIIKLEGFVEDVSKGIFWLVFPWEANGNLRDFIASQDWEIPERISLIHDVAKGVKYLHSHNPPICHGDLKSVNILVNSNCCAVITDFGSASRLTEADLNTVTEHVGSKRQPATRLEATFSASTNTITLTGNEFTLRWAAPELLNDEPPTVKVDIWALGWIAYEVMTNSIPFEDIVKDSVVIRRVTQGHLPSITGDARMSLMLELCCVMSECWNADPIQRPTAADCLKSLRWMPHIAPNPNRTAESMVSEARSPQLLLQLGQMYRHQGDYANASKCFNEALQVSTNAADRKGRADSLWCLAQVCLIQGRVEEAVVSYSDALEIFTSIDDRPMKATALYSLAQAYQFQQKYEGRHVLLGRAGNQYGPQRQHRESSRSVWSR